MVNKQRQQISTFDTVKVSVQYKKTHQKNINQKKLQYIKDKKKQDKRRKQGRKEKNFQNQIYSEVKMSNYRGEKAKMMTPYDPDYPEYIFGYWEKQNHKSGRWITENDIQFMDKHEYFDVKANLYYMEMDEYYFLTNQGLVLLNRHNSKLINY